MLQKEAWKWANSKQNGRHLPQGEGRVSLHQKVLACDKLGAVRPAHHRLHVYHGRERRLVSFQLQK